MLPNLQVEKLLTLETLGLVKILAVTSITTYKDGDLITILGLSG